MEDMINVGAEVVEETAKKVSWFSLKSFVSGVAAGVFGTIAGGLTINKIKKRKAKKAEEQAASELDEIDEMLNEEVSKQ